MSRNTFKISVFLSYPKPHMSRQQQFIDVLCEYLDKRGFTARTLGVTDYDLDAPLTAIRRLMMESNGLVSIAFRRSYNNQIVVNHGADVADRPERVLRDVWSTSVWAHVEPAMAYQLGLPILLVRERGVLVDGMFEPGVTGLHLPEVNLDESPEMFLASAEGQQVMRRWETNVNRVAQSKGTPPRLY
jgi:hypothetical protein